MRRSRSGARFHRHAQPCRPRIAQGPRCRDRISAGRHQHFHRPGRASRTFPCAIIMRSLGDPAAINVASMIGHATLREQVMGKDLYRAARPPQELARDARAAGQRTRAGAFGLSTGLEYAQKATSRPPKKSSSFPRWRRRRADSTSATCAMRATGFRFLRRNPAHRAGGAHSSGDHAHQTRLHPGCGTRPHARMPAYFATAQREHIELSADVYPYTYWYSTIRVHRA